MNAELIKTSLTIAATAARHAAAVARWYAQTRTAFSSTDQEAIDAALAGLRKDYSDLAADNRANRPAV